MEQNSMPPERMENPVSNNRPQPLFVPPQYAPGPYMVPVMQPSPEEQARREQAGYVGRVRRRTNTVTAFVFVYIVILTMAVMISGIASAVYTLIKNPYLLHLGADAIADVFIQSMTSDGIGYLLSLPAIFLMVFLWKKKAFFKNVLFSSRRKMTPGTLLFLIALLFAAQAAGDLLSRGLEWLLHFFGASATSAIQQMQGTSSVTMLIYICIGAPFIEEILLRGAVMRSFQNFGRRFAVVGAAVLFSLMHANLAQIPFAFFAGVILGYAAMEYSIWWSILLHLFNNAVIAEGMSWALGKLPENTAALVSNAVIYGIAAVAVVLCIVFRKRILSCFRSEKTRKGTFKGYFTSPVLIVMIAYAAINSVVVILMSIF